VSDPMCIRVVFRGLYLGEIEESPGSVFGGNRGVPYVEGIIRSPNTLPLIHTPIF